MADSPLRITRRHLPHWTLPGSTYYVTFHLAGGTLSQAERALVVAHIRAGHPRYCTLAALCVMPDHVHMILKPAAGMTLQRILKGIKGVTARRINQMRGLRGTVWQEESWDRILRSEMEYQEKLQYMFDNPMKAGLVVDTTQYDGWWYNPEFPWFLQEDRHSNPQEDRHSCLSGRDGGRGPTNQRLCVAPLTPRPLRTDRNVCRPACVCRLRP